MRAALTALAGAVALTAAAPAPAQTAADRADARCILMLDLVGRDPKNREKAAQGVFYFLGKLTGHGQGQGAKLQALLGQEAKTQINGQAELSRCGKELTNGNAQLGGAFRSLQAAAGAQRSAAPPATAPTTATPGIANPFTAPPK